VKDINERIAVGNDESMKATKIGSLKCQVVQLDCSGIGVTLQEVNYVPRLRVNLLRISNSLNKVFNLSN
jgi:hypothetical protein